MHHSFCVKPCSSIVTTASKRARHKSSMQKSAHWYFVLTAVLVAEIVGAKQPHSSVNHELSAAIRVIRLTLPFFKYGKIYSATRKSYPRHGIPKLLVNGKQTVVHIQSRGIRDDSDSYISYLHLWETSYVNTLLTKTSTLPKILSTGIHRIPHSLITVTLVDRLLR